MKFKKSGTTGYKVVIFLLIGVVIVISNINNNSIADDRSSSIDVVSNTIIYQTKDGVSEASLEEILKVSEKTLRKENRDIKIVYDTETEAIYINEFLGDRAYTQKLLHVTRKNNNLVVK